MKYYPIIFVHGYAGRPGRLGPEDETDPYCGWNKGRRYNLPDEWASYSNTNRDFEGYIIRLWKDYEYFDTLNDSDLTTPIFQTLENKMKTIWIFRYYEKLRDWTEISQAKKNNTLYEKRKEYEAEMSKNESLKKNKFKDIKSLAGIPQYAFMLADETINNILQKTQSDKVFLIAHSMGGLICRFAIQYDIFGFRDKVAKFITLATPHGGASIADKLIFGKDFINPGSKDVEHLGPDWVKKNLCGTKIKKNEFIPQENCYCIIGCNYQDYGISKMLVGKGSDGLVTKDEAFLNGVGKTSVYCTHSNIQSSREPYEVTKRFLFGDISLKIAIVGIKFKTKQRKGNWQYSERRYFFYSSLKVRGVNALLNEISERCENADHHATAKEITALIEKEVYILYDGFLDSSCISAENERIDGKKLLTINVEFRCMEYDKEAGNIPVESASIPFQIDIEESSPISYKQKGKEIDFDLKIEYSKRI